MAKLVVKKINKWLKVAKPAVANEVPDYEGKPDYDAEMMIYDQIGEDYWGGKGVSADTFKTELDSLKGKKVLLRLHSPGGNVYDSMAMATAMKDHGNVDTQIDGLAASAAFSLFQMGNKRMMSDYSMGMAHKASSLMIGNSEQMKQEAEILDKHDQTIAKLLASKSGKSVEECLNIMDKETWMDGAECLANKFCDELTDDDNGDGEQPENKAKLTVNTFDLTRFKHVPTEKLNRINNVNTKNKGAKKTPPQSAVIMNREAMIALLTKWGVAVENNATDQWLLDAVAKGPQNKAAQPENVAELKARLDAIEKERDAARLVNIENRVNKIVANDQIPAVNAPWLKDQAMKDPKVLDVFESLPAKPPGISPVANITTESSSPEDCVKIIKTNRNALAGYLEGRYNKTDELKKAIGAGAAANSKVTRQIIGRLCKDIPDHSSFEERRREVIGDFLENAVRMNDTQQGPYGSATVSSDLQRQVIFSEAMRAFRRRLWPLNAFAHNFGNVPLEGTDTIIVPYYPLYTTGSLRYTSAAGYQTGGTDQAMRKLVSFGGVGSANKIPGVDRAYQPMTWSSYLLRRQPWVDIQKMVTMRVEQLAYDVLTDVTCAWVVPANFGNAVWTGAPSGFDETVVASLQGVANKADWPEGMRNLIIGTDYYTNLASSPYVKAYLNIGDTGVIREGRIGGLYGFEDTIGNPRIPQTSSNDLVGFICYPSAVCVGTAPILPAPGVLKLLASYDIITDDQIGLSFEYRYWGVPQMDQDQEVVECNYGSGLGEVAALKRLTNGGV